METNPPVSPAYQAYTPSCPIITASEWACPPWQESLATASLYPGLDGIIATQDAINSYRDVPSCPTGVINGQADTGAICKSQIVTCSYSWKAQVPDIQPMFLNNDILCSRDLREGTRSIFSSDVMKCQNVGVPDSIWNPSAITSETTQNLNESSGHGLFDHMSLVEDGALCSSAGVVKSHAFASPEMMTFPQAHETSHAVRATLEDLESTFVTATRVAAYVLVMTVRRVEIRTADILWSCILWLDRIARRIRFFKSFLEAVLGRIQTLFNALKKPSFLWSILVRQNPWHLHHGTHPPENDSPPFLTTGAPAA